MRSITKPLQRRSEQSFDGFGRTRRWKIRCQFDERDEHKVSLFHSRVRDLQARLADPLIPKDKDIQVQRPRSVTDAGGAVPAELLLDAKKVLKQGLGVQTGLQCDYGIQETGLIGITDGLRRIE